ncbi:MAG: pilin [Candidatus Magasanikbacteria bacterium]
MFKTYKNFLILSVFLFVITLFFPFSVHASIDQRCWQRESCEGGNGVFYGPTSETIAACGNLAKDPSGKDVGFCTATTQPVTQVGFGGEGAGKKVFENFGKFIQWIYRYGVMTAGLLAMVMIVVAGLQWSTSAGSPERIASAKKRIAGALMGLFVALMSYFILNTVNPYLVNLRMPQVWKINTIGLVSPYCDEVEGGKKLATELSGPFTLEPKEGICGTNYFVEGGGEVTCQGTYCEGRNVCLPFGVDSTGKKTGPKCDDKILSIHYMADSSARTFFTAASGAFQNAAATAEALFTDRLNEPDWLDRTAEDTKLIVMCESSDTKLYFDKFVEFEDNAWYWTTIKKDQNGNDLPYYEYLLQYDSLSLQQGINGKYKCEDQNDKGVGFFIKNDLNLDLQTYDINAYISSVPKSKRLLQASRLNGVPGGFWYIPFAIFEKKNHFFELNITGDMINNMVHSAFSEPAVGKKAKGQTANNFWGYVGDNVRNFWGIIVKEVVEVVT